MPLRTLLPDPQAVHDEPSSPVAARGAAARNEPPPRVLIADAPARERSAMATALRDSGCQVLEADTGAAALELAAHADFDVLILAVDLPDMDGLDVGRALRKRNGAPAVLHVASRAQHVSPAARSDASDAYLLRPFRIDDLHSVVGALTRLRRQRPHTTPGASRGNAERRHGSGGHPERAMATSLMHEALDTLAEHVALLAPDGDVVAVNRAWIDFARDNGYRDGATGLGSNYPAICDQAADAAGAARVIDAEARDAAAGIRAVLSGERDSFTMDYRCDSPTAERHFRMTARRVAAPGPVAAVVTHANITEQVLAARVAERQSARAEAAYAARATEEVLFRALTDQSHEFVSILGLDGRFRYVSPSVKRALGYHPEELAGTDPSTLVHPEDRRMLRVMLLQLARRGNGAATQATVRLKHRDGSWRYFEGGAQNLIDQPAVRGITTNVRDVTERRAAALDRDNLWKALELERTRLARVFEDAPAFLAVLRGPDHVFERVNPAYRAMIGDRELIGRPAREAMPEIVEQGFIDLLDHVRETGQIHVGHQTPILLARKAGAQPELRYVDFVYQRLADPDGDVRVVAHGVDVSERVLAESALRESEERLRELFAKLPVATFLWELRGDDFVLADLNDAAALLMQDQWEDPLGRTATALFPEGWTTRETALRCLRKGTVIRESIEYGQWRGAAGEMRTFDVTVGPQPPDRVLIHAVDTTEQTRLSNALRQAQKMEAVGQLAGGVAHDFNNLLTVIAAHSAFLLDDLAPNDPRREDARAIQQAGDRASALTRQLLAFSRKQVLKPAVTSLNRVIEETQRMLSRLLPEDVLIVPSLAPDLGDVLVDAGQVGQVLINLVINARDAMPSGGRLSITTRNATVDQTWPAAIRDTVPDGAYAVLSVSDTGTGMDARTRARVFEPFFTTKGLGKGTGLGLSTVYGIVKQSSGYITVDSAPGAGATFEVYLPLVHATPDATGAPHEDSETPPTQPSGRTILLVEDDDRLRELAGRILRAEGYDVLTAVDGRAAVSLSEMHDGVIDAVITDSVMPGVSGLAVLRDIRVSRPACRAMLMSGYTEDDITRKEIGSDDFSFIQKPFTPAEFVEAVRTLLDP